MTVCEKVGLVMMITVCTMMLGMDIEEPCIQYSVIGIYWIGMMLFLVGGEKKEQDD